MMVGGAPSHQLVDVDDDTVLLGSFWQGLSRCHKSLPTSSRVKGREDCFFSVQQGHHREGSQHHDNDYSKGDAAMAEADLVKRGTAPLCATTAVVPCRCGTDASLQKWNMMFLWCFLLVMSEERMLLIWLGRDAST